MVWWRRPGSLVLATCSMCGDVMVPADTVVVSATNGTASLTCPVCNWPVVVLLDRDSDMMLIAAGAEVVL